MKIYFIFILTSLQSKYINELGWILRIQINNHFGKKRNIILICIGTRKSKSMKIQLNMFKC